MDCTVLISRQLLKIQTLLAWVRQLPISKAKLLAYRELCDRAASHIQIRERLLWPILQQRGGADAPTDAVHQKFKQAVAHMMVSPPEGLEFERGLDTLEQVLLIQMDIDRRALVPALRMVTDVSERRSLCLDIELAYLTTVPDETQRLEDMPTCRELVNEAQVVLSSLPSEGLSMYVKRSGANRLKKPGKARPRMSAC